MQNNPKFKELVSVIKPKDLTINLKNKNQAQASTITHIMQQTSGTKEHIIYCLQKYDF